MVVGNDLCRWGDAGLVVGEVGGLQCDVAAWKDGG